MIRDQSGLRPLWLWTGSVIRLGSAWWAAEIRITDSRRVRGNFLMGMALRYPWMLNELDMAIAECDRVLGNPNSAVMSFVVTQRSGRKPN